MSVELLSPHCDPRRNENAEAIGRAMEEYEQGLKIAANAARRLQDIHRIERPWIKMRDDSGWAAGQRMRLEIRY